MKNEETKGHICVAATLSEMGAGGKFRGVGRKVELGSWVWSLGWGGNFKVQNPKFRECSSTKEQ
jgi:hypothetical protein